MAVAQVLTSIAKLVFVVLILLTYQPWITLAAVASLIPSILATRWGLNFVFKTAKAAQGAKSTMSGMTEETISNIKTVKCFAEE